MSFVAQHGLAHSCCLHWKESCGLQEKTMGPLKSLAEKYLTILCFSLVRLKWQNQRLLILEIQMCIQLSGILLTGIWVFNWDELPILPTKPMHYLNEDCHSIPSWFNCFTWMWNVFIFYCCYKISSKQKLQKPQGNCLLTGKITSIISIFISWFIRRCLYEQGFNV